MICDVCNRDGQKHQLMMPTCDECLCGAPALPDSFVKVGSVFVPNEPAFSAAQATHKQWRQERAKLGEPA